jgi:hypothetical protein
MSAVDIAGWFKSATDLWERGSLFLWALAIAAFISLGLFSTLALVDPALGTLAWTPWFGVATVVLVCLAAFKTYQERTIKTLHFIPDDQQSFWHHAPQVDGRKLTQIALRGRVTNIAAQPMYPAAVVLRSPRGQRTVHRLIFTEEHGGRYYGSDYAIPAGERTGFSAHFFANGFLGTPGEPLTIVISVSDQFGHWHRVKFPKLTRPEDRGM